MMDLLNKKPVQKMPKEVLYYNMCKEFKCLPGPGGLLDQDPGILEAFLLCMNTEAEHSRIEDEKRRAKEKRDKNRK